MDSHFYKAKGGRPPHNASGHRNDGGRASGGASNTANSSQPPDTSNWETANERDSNYHFAQTVANKVIGQISHRYPAINVQPGLELSVRGGQDTTDSPHKVVKFKIFSSKNAQEKDETEYYVKIEVDTQSFKYVIAHIGVNPEYLTVLYESWTTNT